MIPVKTPAKKPLSISFDVLFIISGSISAYKSLDIIRELQRKNFSFKIILSKNASQFVTPLSISSLCQSDVRQEFYSTDDENNISHIELARQAKLIVVCPASASLLSRFASASCDDLASTLLIASSTKALLFPAMNPEMWSNNFVQKNVNILLDEGHTIISPEEGTTACGEYGCGRLPEVKTVINIIEYHLNYKPILNNMNVLITAGPTIEAIDDARALTNFSSGIQGYAIAKEFSLNGASVTLISGKTALEAPYGLKCINVISGREMYKETIQSLPQDIVVCCSAVSDWYTEKTIGKIKKYSGLNIKWKENPDILSCIGHGKTAEGVAFSRPKLVIGFAAESMDIRKHAELKLKAKSADWIFANDISQGVFGSKNNSVLFLKYNSTKNVEIAKWCLQSKVDIAKKIVDNVIKSL